MDTQAFLLKRETLRDRLTYIRSYSLAAARRHKPWWLMLPLFPLAAWLLTRGGASNGSGGRHPHPVIKSFLTAGVMKLLSTIARGLPADKPSFFRRIFAA